MNGQGTGKISYSLTRLRYRRGSLYRRSTVWLILMGLPKVQAISRLLIIFAINGSVCWVCTRLEIWGLSNTVRKICYLAFPFFFKDRKKEWPYLPFTQMAGRIFVSTWVYCNITLSCFFFLISTKSGWLPVYKNSKTTRLRLSHLKTEERPDRSKIISPEFS